MKFDFGENRKCLQTNSLAMTFLLKRRLTQINAD